MLKKIRVEQLKVGMYVHALCGTWLSHDFWRTSFALDRLDSLLKLRSSPVKEVWIDTDRGLDLSDPAISSAIDASIKSTKPSTLEEELRRATEICADAREIMVHMFSKVRVGQSMDMATAQELVTAIANSVQRHPEALISIARLKTTDNYTYMHSVAVCSLMVALARNMGMNTAQVQQAGLAGLLHDIGKAEIDLDILNKPGPLDEAEMGQMKLHPVKGHAILQTCMEDAAILDACLHHHERLDGKGYPHGLSNEQLTRLTRMTAICDIYDAITSDRPYKKGWSPTEALQRMKQWCHAHIDAQIFEVFVRTIGVYPLGSLVRMQSGLLGVVCGSASSSMSRPKVMVFYHIGLQRMLRTPQVVDLEKMPEECIADSEEPSQWPTLNMEQLCQKAAKLVNLA